jgi:hypothetical protein
MEVPLWQGPLNRWLRSSRGRIIFLRNPKSSGTFGQHSCYKTSLINQSFPNADACGCCDPCLTLMQSEKMDWFRILESSHPTFDKTLRCHCLGQKVPRIFGYKTGRVPGKKCYATKCAGEPCWGRKEYGKAKQVLENPCLEIGQTYLHLPCGISFRRCSKRRNFLLFL